MNLSVFFVLICIIINDVAAVANTVPVLLLDYDQVMTNVQIEPNPFAKLTSEHFGKVVRDFMRNKVIVFVEDSFSVEDISTKDKTGTVFKNLRANLLEDRNRVKYLPSVIEPYQTLKKIFLPNKNNVYYIAQRTKLLLKEKFKHVYMYFQDSANETRADALRRHDNMMKEILNAVRQLNTGPIVAFYTGKFNPISVKKVEFVKSSPNELVRMGSSPRVLFKLRGVRTTKQTRRGFIYDQPPMIHDETFSTRKFTTRVSSEDLDIIWIFNFDKQEWKIGSRWMQVSSNPIGNLWGKPMFRSGRHTADIIMIKKVEAALFEAEEEVGSIPLQIKAPRDSAYFCAEPIVILNSRDGSTLTIHEVLIDFGKPLKKMKFCAPYFSSTILSCFFVTFILLIILMYGVMMLFDCTTYSRFDDPNAEALVHETMH